MRLLLTADPELPVPPKLYGGIERIIDFLVRGLRERGHTVGLVAHEESTVPNDGFFPWPGKQSQNRKDLVKNLRALRGAVNAFRPDVLHSFSRVAYLFPLLLAPLPKIMSYQRNPSLRTAAWGSRLSRGTLTFTGCSEHICDIGRRGGGTWVPIHNGVELEKYTFSPAVKDDAPLVFLSRLDPVKNPVGAIHAARKAGRRLIVAGNYANSGPDREYYDRQVKPLLDKDGVEYIGPVNDEQKNKLLGEALAMIVPIQWNEPFGIVFAEALACGTPVISSPRGALPEIVRQGEHGFLVEGVDACVDAIGKLSSISRAACRQRAEKAFAAPVIVGQYEQLYKSMNQKA
jgi:glycosyltransferase involved in cell wall biosynthesis